MKVYETQKEVEKDIKDGVLAIDGDVKFKCDIDIKANIIAENINAGDIDALNINAGDINAENINALNIIAGDINYYAVCISYSTLKCKSIEGSRGNHIHKCLDGDIEFRDEEEKVTIKISKATLEQLKKEGVEIIK